MARKYSLLIFNSSSIQKNETDYSVYNVIDLLVYCKINSQTSAICWQHFNCYQQTNYWNSYDFNFFCFEKSSMSFK